MFAVVSRARRALSVVAMVAAMGAALAVPLAVSEGGVAFAVFGSTDPSTSLHPGGKGGMSLWGGGY